MMEKRDGIEGTASDLYPPHLVGFMESGGCAIDWLAGLGFGGILLRPWDLKRFWPPNQCLSSLFLTEHYPSNVDIATVPTLLSRSSAGSLQLASAPAFASRAIEFFGHCA